MRFYVCNINQLYFVDKLNNNPRENFPGDCCWNSFKVCFWAEPLLFVVAAGVAVPDKKDNRNGKAKCRNTS